MISTQVGLIRISLVHDGLGRNILFIFSYILCMCLYYLFHLFLFTNLFIHLSLYLSLYVIHSFILFNVVFVYFNYFIFYLVD